MNTFDRQLQTGSAFLIAPFSAIAVLFSVLAVTGDQHRYLSLLLVVLSLNGAWKNHRARAGRATPLQEHEA